MTGITENYWDPVNRLPGGGKDLSFDPPRIVHASFFRTFGKVAFWGAFAAAVLCNAFSAGGKWVIGSMEAQEKRAYCFPHQNNSDPASLLRTADNTFFTWPGRKAGDFLASFFPLDPDELGKGTKIVLISACDQSCQRSIIRHRVPVHAQNTLK